MGDALMKKLTFFTEHEKLLNTSQWVMRVKPYIQGDIRNNKEEEDMPSQGRQVDVSQLSDEECSKILTVISKDILLRKSEKARVAYVNKKFDELRRSITISNVSRKKRLPFDDYCLICGKHLFTFICLLNLGEECISCEHQCCSACRKALIFKGDSWMERCFICKLCIEKRECKRKSFEWFHELAEKRFKRFGSAKILRAVYKQKTSIEPRVITLLAHCREIQPTRRISITSLQKRYSVNYSKDDEKISYFSSQSDPTTTRDADGPQVKRHTTIPSVEEVGRTNKVNSRSYSDSVIAVDFHRPTPKDITLVDMASKEETPVSQTQSPITPKRISNGHVQPDSLQAVVMEDTENEGLVIVESKVFSKADYFGLVSLTLTVFFAIVLFTCVGFVFDPQPQSSDLEDEDVE